MEQCKLFPRPARGMSYGILWSIRCGTVQTVPPPRQGHELQHALAVSYTHLLITAPLGAIGIAIGYKKLLTKEETYS